MTVANPPVVPVARDPSAPTVHVQQRGPNDCGIAACAMATGLPYERVLELFSDWTRENAEARAEGREERGTDETHYRRFFRAIGWKVFGPIGGWQTPGASDVIRSMLWGRRALISVHSGNNDGGFHMVYFDGARVWDPQQGRSDKLAFGPLLWALPVRSCWIFPEVPAAL